MPPQYSRIKQIPVVGLIRDTDKQDIQKHILMLERVFTSRLIRLQQFTEIYREQMQMSENSVERMAAHDLATAYASEAMRAEQDIRRIAQLQEKVFRAFGIATEDL